MKQPESEFITDQLKDIGKRVIILGRRDKELGEVRATLTLNFVRRTTHGVNVEGGDDMSTLNLMIEVITKLSGQGGEKGGGE